MKQCPNCHAMIAETAAFCTNCGHKIDALASATTSDSAPMPTQRPVVPPTSGAFSSATTAPAPAATATAPRFTTEVAPKATKTGLNKNVLIGIGIAAALVVAVAFFFIGRATTGTSSNLPTPPSSSSSSNSTANVANTTTYASTETASLGTYTLAIPEGYYYESVTQDGYQAVAMTDSTESWAALITYVSDVPFSSIEAKITDMAATVNSSSFGTTTVGNTDFYYIDIEPSTGQFATMWFTRAGSKTFMITTYNAEHSVDHSVIEKVEPIIASVVDRSMNRSSSGESSTPAILDFKITTNLGLPTE